MRAAKQSDSPSGYCRDVYVRRAERNVSQQDEYDRRIRNREIAAERERITWGVGNQEDPTGFAPGAWI